MATVNDTVLDQMLDREAIRELPVRYCHYVWTKNAAGIADLFTDDGSMDSSTWGTQSAGRAAILEFYTKAIGQDEPKPFIHNHVIELQGPDRAIGWCYAEIRDGKKGMRPWRAGYYEDEYRKVGGVWKFKSRKSHMTPLNS